MNFSDKIKKLSQSKLAEKLGIAPAHLCNLEQGKYLPSFDVLKKLSSIFEVSADYLLNDANDDLDIIKIQDNGLVEKIMMLNSLEGKDKETVFNVIDAMLTKKKMLALLTEKAG